MGAIRSLVHANNFDVSEKFMTGFTKEQAVYETGGC